MHSIVYIYTYLWLRQSDVRVELHVRNLESVDEASRTRFARAANYAERFDRWEGE